MMSPRYIPSQHPKIGIPFSERSIDKAVAAGWWGQLKMDGWRAQVHVSSRGEVCAYTRHGRIHTRPLPKTLIDALNALAPTVQDTWNVFDCEWMYTRQKLFFFDILRCDGELLNKRCYAERFETLEATFKPSPPFEILPIYRTVDDCLAAVASDDLAVEGLVLKNPTSIGWRDSSIIRCRKR